MEQNRKRREIINKINGKDYFLEFEAINLFSEEINRLRDDAYRANRREVS